VRRHVLYNIVIEFGTSMKLIRLIKMCLNGTNNKVLIGTILSYVVLIQNDLRQGDYSSP